MIFPLIRGGWKNELLFLNDFMVSRGRDTPAWCFDVNFI